MKKLAIVLLFASPLCAQVQLGKGVQVGGTSSGGGGITSLTGDVTATGPGSTVATVVKVNGGAVPMNALAVGTNGSQQFVTSGLAGTGTALMTFTGATPAGNLIGSNSSGTAIDSGVSPANLVLLGGNNVYTGINQYLTNISVANLTASTSGANHSSPLTQLEGTYWTGSVSADDTWGWQNVMGIGTNPTATLTLSHSGTSGTKSVNIPFGITVLSCTLSGGGSCGGGGGGGFTAGGDLSGSSTSQQVIGINGVPLCAGFTPTDGKVLEYVTSSSPNPCYQPGGLAPPDEVTYNPAGVSDGGSAFAAALTRYNNNQPQSGSVNPSTSALGFLQFQSAPVNPQYAEQTVALPPFWTHTHIILEFYTTVTSGNVEWEVETACTPANGVVGSPTFSSPFTVTTTVSTTPDGLVSTAIINNIALPGVNSCQASGSTTPSIMTYRVFRAASDTAAGDAFLIGTLLFTGRSQ